MRDIQRWMVHIITVSKIEFPAVHGLNRYTLRSALFGFRHPDGGGNSETCRLCCLLSQVTYPCSTPEYQRCRIGVLWQQILNQAASYAEDWLSLNKNSPITHEWCS